MTVEHRLAEAVRRKTQAVPAPSIDVVALRQDARRQARLRIAVATAAAVIVGTLGGVALWQRTRSPSGFAQRTGRSPPATRTACAPSSIGTRESCT